MEQNEQVKVINEALQKMNEEIKTTILKSAKTCIVKILEGDKEHKNELKNAILSTAQAACNSGISAIDTVLSSDFVIDKDGNLTI